MGLGERVRVGGVADLAVEGNDAKVASSESGHGVAVGSAGGDPVTSRMDRIDPQLPGELRHRGEVGGRERRDGAVMGWSSEGGVQLESASGGFEETARPGGGNTPRRSVDLRFGSTAWPVDRATRSLPAPAAGIAGPPSASRRSRGRRVAEVVSERPACGQSSRDGQPGLADDVDGRASGGGAPDHGAYLNGWRNASAALTGGTTNSISPSDRLSWTTIWVCPVSRSHSSVTVRPSPCRVSSSTNIERPHVVPTARREFLRSGACEHCPTLALERAEIVEVCCPGRVVWEAVDELRCVGVGVQQLVRELRQARARLRARSVIAATADAGGAWVNGLGRGMRATTGCAEPKADHGPAGARRGLKPDCG